MALTTNDKKQIETLVKEGKKIAHILRENFPKNTYSEIYAIAYERTDGSSLGIKKKITNRLNGLVKTGSKQEKNDLAKEIRELVNALYKQHKEMSAKLSEIRDALD